MSLADTNRRNALKFFERMKLHYRINIALEVKEDSSLMQRLAWFYKIAKINPWFLTNTPTIFGSTIYVPRSYIEEMNANDFMSLMLHESTHIFDSKRYKGLYSLTYSQELFFGLPLLIVAFVLLGFKTWVAASILLGLGILCLLPVPKPGRYLWELHGFAANVYWATVLGYPEEVLETMRAWAAKELSSKKYYFVWPFEQYTKNLLKDPKRFCSFPKEIELFFKEDFVTG
jgi:hypothetical protein